MSTKKVSNHVSNIEKTLNKLLKGHTFKVEVVGREDPIPPKSLSVLEDIHPLLLDSVKRLANSKICHIMDGDTKLLEVALPGDPLELNEAQLLYDKILGEVTSILELPRISLYGKK